MFKVGHPHCNFVAGGDSTDSRGRQGGGALISGEVEAEQAGLWRVQDSQGNSKMGLLVKFSHCCNDIREKRGYFGS